MFKGWFKIKKYPESEAKSSQDKLDKKVEEGTDRAVREYHQTFKKLEDYDKQEQGV